MTHLRYGFQKHDHITTQHCVQNFAIFFGTLVVTQLHCAYRADVVLGCITGKPAQLIAAAREIVKCFQQNKEHMPYLGIGADVSLDQWWRVLGMFH